MARNLLSIAEMPRDSRTVLTIFLALAAGWAACAPALADDGAFSVPLVQQPSGAFYVRGIIGDSIETELLVDTGSTYVVLTPLTFKALEKSEGAIFKRTIHGTTAGGRVLKARVYEITALAIGDNCVLESVEAVILPGSNRNILGLSALKRVQPFTFDLDPLALRFGGCRQPLEDSLLATTSARTSGIPPIP